MTELTVHLIEHARAMANNLRKDRLDGVAATLDELSNRLDERLLVNSGLLKRLRAWHEPGETITGDVALYLEAAEKIERQADEIRRLKQVLWAAAQSHGGTIDIDNKHLINAGDTGAVLTHMNRDDYNGLIVRADYI